MNLLLSQVAYSSKLQGIKRLLCWHFSQTLQHLELRTLKKQILHFLDDAAIVSLLSSAIAFLPERLDQKAHVWQRSCPANSKITFLPPVVAMDSI